MTDVISLAENDRINFFCPACGLPHTVTINDSTWSWNGSKETPTFKPSVLVRQTLGNFKYKDDPEYKETENVCHSFVTNGVIEYLSDSTHQFAGQSLRIQPWPYNQSEL